MVGRHAGGAVFNHIVRTDSPADQVRVLPRLVELERWRVAPILQGRGQEQDDGRFPVDRLLDAEMELPAAVERTDYQQAGTGAQDVHADSGALVSSVAL